MFTRKKFTSSEGAQIVKIALDAELDGYQDNQFLKKVILLTQNKQEKIHDLFEWLFERNHIRALQDLYLELTYLSSDAVNPLNFHELERI